jgi:hypothetical protein
MIERARRAKELIERERAAAPERPGLDPDLFRQGSRWRELAQAEDEATGQRDGLFQPDPWPAPAAGPRADTEAVPAAKADHEAGN